MPTTREYLEVSIEHTVDDPIAAIDANTSPARKTAREQLGFSGWFALATLDLFYQGVYLANSFLVLGLPVEVIVPGFFMPVFLHRQASISS